MKLLVVASLALLQACSTGGSQPVGDGAVERGPTAAAGVWPSDATKLLAVASGGFVPMAPAGSECRIVDDTFTFSVAAKTLEWRNCQGKSFTWEAGTTSLSDSQFTVLVAALKRLAVSERSTCGADKEQLTLTISAASGDTSYIDSFYGCSQLNGARPAVDNIDPVFRLLRDAASNTSSPDAGKI